jgi:hypothetical protein
VREINREREWKRYGERESEWVREREGDGGEREIQVIVWSCRVNSLRMLGERDRGKEGGREGENEWGRDFWAKERESEGEREIGERMGGGEGEGEREKSWEREKVSEWVSERMKVCVCRVSSLFMLGWEGRERESKERRRERGIGKRQWEK